MNPPAKESPAPVGSTIFSKGKAGEITLQIQKLYYNIVRGKNDQYNSWLTYF